MNIPLSKWVDTVDLRTCYKAKQFTFGREGAGTRVVLVGSCRILNFLNFFRVYNHFTGHPFDLICLNPVECWTPGESVADTVRVATDGYHIGVVDWMICEHVEHCGAMNTMEDNEENVFKSLKCVPLHDPIRMPNWVYMFIYDIAFAEIQKEYAALTGSARVDALRVKTEECRARFLNYCKESSFPELAQWAEDNWLSTRLGWTGNHSTMALSRKIFQLIAGVMGLVVTPEMESHQHFALDRFASTGTPMTPVDYEANNWKF